MVFVFPEGSGKEAPFFLVTNSEFGLRERALAGFSPHFAKEAMELSGLPSKEKQSAPHNYYPKD